MTKTKLLNASFLVGLLLAPSLSAATIPKLYNTGVNDSKALLADATVDPHYKLTISADATNSGPNAFTLNPGDISPWLAEGPISRWIAPSPAGRTTGAFGADDQTGDYTYETTFDLTGFDPTTAVITGQWSTDNTGQDIVLNGTSLGLDRKSTRLNSSHGYISY